MDISKMSTEQLMEQVALSNISAADAANEIKNRNKQQASKAKQVNYKVSTKGAISFYGIRRMPITLYVGELEALVGEICGNLDWEEKFGEFLDENQERLSRK